jgi:hypothetical protein
MSKNILAVSYGFEYNKIIIKDKNCCIGKSLINKNTVYCSVMIKDEDIDTIVDKIKLIKLHREDYLSKIDSLASEYDAIAKWQVVLYNKDYEYYVHVL